jgi:hypothetical protein
VQSHSSEQVSIATPPKPFCECIQGGGWSPVVLPAARFLLQIQRTLEPSRARSASPSLIFLELENGRRKRPFSAPNRHFLDENRSARARVRVRLRPQSAGFLEWAQRQFGSLMLTDWRI